MALHRNFPRSPYEVLSPDLRWFPAAEELRSTAYEKLLPPLVANVREQVKAWRDANYAGASATSRALTLGCLGSRDTSQAIQHAPKLECDHHEIMQSAGRVSGGVDCRSELR